MSWGSAVSKAQRMPQWAFIHSVPHSSIEEREQIWDKYDYYRVVSIDPGLRNLCIRVEKRPKDPNNIFIETEAFLKINICREVRIEKERIDNTFVEITKILDSIWNHISTAHFIIIENQVSASTLNCVIQRHILTYCEIKLANTELLPVICSVSPKLKTRKLGCPPNLNEKGIKQWTPKEALRILKRRGDQFGIDTIESALASSVNKADDFADTLCQVEALFMEWGLPITPRYDFESVYSRDIDVQATDTSTSKSLNSFLQLPINNTTSKVNTQNTITLNIINDQPKPLIITPDTGSPQAEAITKSHYQHNSVTRKPRVVSSSILGNEEDFKRRQARQSAVKSSNNSFSPIRMPAVEYYTDEDDNDSDSDAIIYYPEEQIIRFPLQNVNDKID